MSLDSTIARISQLETAFAPPSAASTGGVAPTSSPGPPNASQFGAAADAVGASPPTSFASQLQGAMAPSALTPGAGGGAAAMVRIAEGEVGQAEQPPGSNDSPRIAV